MIGELLPGTVVVVEAYGDEGADAPLYPEEAHVMARAVDKRRREFTAVRSCARRAMKKLGVPPQPVLPGERGAPGWPDGLTGSMTHCAGYCAAALVRTGDLASLGIDAEVQGPLPEGVLSSVALPGEAERIGRLTLERPGVHWDRLLFSAKEAVYKAWFPLTGKWLDFMEADIELFAEAGSSGTGAGDDSGGSDSGGSAVEGAGAPLRGGFRAALLVPGPRVGDHRLDHFDGRWAVEGGLVATAVAVPHG
ncbi:4'-phosphopantetheinyl transferase superfamily protein [Streptomyces hirsutus]|uniref:4'-phosphopantetheinyl transferase superfamily protein n=1 Tax=Streptomyces hirsutus TaxID=35620 RepID=A0ABZ1GZN9_9ACTN|nr:4'-phosphopantetheinyl transferase superfamily protein [Streptomyces hirsutus]WSD10283.1 4'-phosphopantetheinyl transferase superfamily protein [Streptomyces hirsutus]WTD16368.1 4'-phosphopantetheinyl transferase superfamily protein [Streptomyces hirsutus]